MLMDQRSIAHKHSHNHFGFHGKSLGQFCCFDFEDIFSKWSWQAAHEKWSCCLACSLCLCIQGFYIGQETLSVLQPQKFRSNQAHLYQKVLSSCQSQIPL